MNTDLPPEQDPGLYGDSRADIDAMYGRKNPAADYGEPVLRATVRVDEPTESTKGPEQLTLFDEEVNEAADELTLRPVAEIINEAKNKLPRPVVSPEETSRRAATLALNEARRAGTLGPKTSRRRDNK